MVSYTSYAIIGIKVNPSKFTTLEEKRGCKCEVEGIEKMKFCPRCGAKSFVKEKVPIPQFKEDRDDDKFHNYQSLCNYAIIYPDAENDGEAYVAAMYVDDSSYTEKNKNRMRIPKDIETIKEKMKKLLKPIGLWDEKKFGLWAVLETNY